MVEENRLNSFFKAAYSYRTKFNCALGMSLELVLPPYRNHLGDHPYTASVLNSIGNYYEAIGDHENAIKYTEEALSMRITLLGEHQETARSYYDLGVALKGKVLFENRMCSFPPDYPKEIILGVVFYLELKLIIQIVTFIITYSYRAGTSHHGFTFMICEFSMLTSENQTGNLQMLQ